MEKGEKGEESAALPASSEIYHGVLPCASCPGIDTWVLLSGDERNRHFKMVERYLEEDAVFITEGSVRKMDETTIVLEKEGSRENYLYRKGDNQLCLLSESDKKEGESNAAQQKRVLFDYTLYKMPPLMDQ